MRSCSICGRGALNAYSRSHSNIATKRKQHINLQSLVKDGKRVQACTACLRTQTKNLERAAATN